MQIDNPIRLIRELKGAPLSIVLVLQIVRQRVTQEYLERATGYTDKPVSQALGYLCEIGLADHTRDGWQLSQARQLPLGLEEEQLTTETQSPQGDKEGEGGQDNSDTNGVSRKYSDSLIIITDSDSLNSERGNNNNNNGPPNRKNSDLIRQNMEALAAARVVGVKRCKLALLEHVTPGYVRAWEAQLKHEKGSRYTPGLLIVTIESGLPAPEVSENGHARGCACEECRRLVYGTSYDSEGCDEDE
jgi:hypothetical protein